MIRGARRDDLAGVVAVMNALDVALLGEPDSTESDIGSGWDEEDFDLAADAFVAEDGDGHIVAYAEVYDGGHGEQLDVDVIAPAGTDDAIISELLTAALQRADERSGPGWRHTNWLTVDDHRWPAFRAAGFVPQREFVRMRFDLTDVPPEPANLPGITVRPCRQGEDEPTVHDVLVEAFAEHVRPMSPSFERFRERNVHHPNFDPSLWFLAFDGDAAVGALTCFDNGDVAFIPAIGVRNAHRQRGIATVLIRRVLRALHQRGQMRADLGVDLDDVVGAARLYEQIGFTPILKMQLAERVVREAV